MRFFITIALVAFFGAVAALPAGHPFIRAECDIVGCVAALAPTVVGCTAAAAQGGANPISDAACLASAANSVINLPADCDQCLEKFDVENKVKKAAKAAGSKIKDTAEDVADGAGDVVDKIGDKLGSIF